jgi:hypothetical protein
MKALRHRLGYAAALAAVAGMISAVLGFAWPVAVGVAFVTALVLSHRLGDAP